MKTRKITEGAILLAIYAVLLLIFLYLPLIGTFISLVLPVPFLYFTAKYNWKDGLLFFVGSLGITIILGSFLALATPFVFGLTGVTFGYFIYNKKDRFSAFMASTLVLLINLIVQYAISVVLFEVNYIQELLIMVEESIEQSISLMGVLGQEVSPAIQQQFGDMVDTIKVLLPSLFVVSSAIMVLFIQLVSYPIIKRLGIDLPDAKPFREMTLPKSFVWFFLILLLLSLFIPVEEGTFVYNAIVNLVYIIQILFIFQGVTFIFFFSHQKRLHKALPIIITIFALLNPLFHQLVRILGIIDLGFDLRKRMEGNNN